MKLTTALALAFTALATSTVAVGCGGDKSSTTGGTAAAGSSTAASTAGNKPAIVATCARKTACTEYRKEIPDLAEGLCTGTEGKFNKGSTPCPTDKLVGSCTPKSSPDSVTLYYGGPDDLEIAKGLCDVLEGSWTPAPAASGSAPAGAGAGAPQAKGTPPAAPPAAKEPAAKEPAAKEPAAPKTAAKPPAAAAKKKK
jgi:hypothetical protein